MHKTKTRLGPGQLWNSVSKTWRRMMQKDSNLQKEVIVFDSHFWKTDGRMLNLEVYFTEPRRLRQIDTYRLLLALSHREANKEGDSVQQAMQRVDEMPERARESEVGSPVWIFAILAV